MEVKRKRRFQFSLRTQLIFVAALAAALLDLPASSVVVAAEAQAEKPLEVWKYRLILPTYKETRSLIGLRVYEAGPPADFGDLYVDPASGHYVYQYWRESPLDGSSNDVPREKLAGKPTDGKPLRSAYGFDGTRLWAAYFDGWASVIHAPARHPKYSWQAATIEFVEHANRNGSPKFMDRWWEYAPIQRLFDQIDCEKWTRDELLKALRASRQAKAVAKLAELDELRVVTDWKIGAHAQMFAHVPKGFSTAFLRLNDWEWAQLVAIDDNELGIDKCLIDACGSTSGGIAPPRLTRLEIDRDGKQAKTPAIFQPESYGDDLTEIVRIVADKVTSR